MIGMRAGLTLLTLGALLAIAAPAWADSTDAVKAFEEGRKLRDERLFDSAAKAFERSLAAEESIGVHFNLGYCYDQLSRPYDALAAYRRAATLARERSDPRLGDANSAIQKLLESHDHVVLATPADVKRARGLEVEVDRHAVPEGRLNGEVFSPGSVHTVTVSAEGHQRVRATLKNGERFTVVLGAPSPSGAEPSAASPWGWQKWTGLGLVGAGVVTAGVGLVVALGYYSDQDQLKRELAAFCQTQQCLTPKPDERPTPEAQAFFTRAEDLDSAAVTRNAIVFGAAGALVVGGAILFLTAPSSSESETPPTRMARVRVLPHVGPRDSGLSVVGTF